MQSLKTANMVREILKEFPISQKVQQAFLSIDREIFTPNGFAYLAYSLDALPMGANQWIICTFTL